MTIKRLFYLVCPIIALCGSLGLLTFHRALGSVFRPFLEYPSDALLSYLMELQYLFVSEAIFFTGIATTLLSSTSLDCHPKTTSHFRRLQFIGGVLLVIGSAVLIWGIIEVQRSFWIIGSSPYTPEASFVQKMIQNCDQKMMIGFALWCFSAVVMLIAFSIIIQSKQPHGFRWKRPEENGDKILELLLKVVFS